LLQYRIFTFINVQLRNRINIAIDGFSGCGKSTLAKALARHLQYKYIDTGAMYRAITWYFLGHNIDAQQLDVIQRHLPLMDIDFRNENGDNKAYLNGIALNDELNTPEVSAHVSEFAVIADIRYKLVALQQKMGAEKGVVMDGRDIGTVVLPLADLKIFVICDDNVRAMRRYRELHARNIETTIEEVKANLISRDKIDSSRTIGPLSMAEDAILLDNSYFTPEEQLEFVLNRINQLKH